MGTEGGHLCFFSVVLHQMMMMMMKLGGRCGGGVGRVHCFIKSSLCSFQLLLLPLKSPSVLRQLQTHPI